MSDLPLHIDGTMKCWARCAVGALWAAAAGCHEPYTVDPNANQPPAVIGVNLASSLVMDGIEDLSGDVQPSAEVPPSSGEAGALYTYLQNQPTPITGTQAIYPGQFPEILFNKLMDGSTIELAQTDPVTGRLLGFCAPAPGSPIQLFEGTTPLLLLQTCYSPSDLLVTVRPASAINPPPVGPMPRPFLKYLATYTVKLTDAVHDKQGRSISPPFSISLAVGPFAVFSVTDIRKTAQLYGLDPSIAVTGPGRLPQQDAALRLVFTGPIAPALNPDGTVPGRAYPGFNIYHADANFNPGAPVTQTDSQGHVVSVLFTTSDGKPDNRPGSTDPRVLFAYHPSFVIAAASGDTLGMSNAGFDPGNYLLSIPTSFADNGSVTGSAVPLTANPSLPPGTTAIQIQFRVPSG